MGLRLVLSAVAIGSAFLLLSGCSSHIAGTPVPQRQSGSQQHAETSHPGGGYPYNPSEDRNGDGVVNGYERCGVRCGDAPTSGDDQMRDGCERGYITGPSCDPYRKHG